MTRTYSIVRAMRNVHATPRHATPLARSATQGIVNVERSSKAIITTNHSPTSELTQHRAIRWTVHFGLYWWHEYRNGVKHYALWYVNKYDLRRTHLFQPRIKCCNCCVLSTHTTIKSNFILRVQYLYIILPILKKSAPIFNISKKNSKVLVILCGCRRFSHYLAYV